MSNSLERQIQQLLNRVRRLEDDRQPPAPESWLQGPSSSVKYAWPPSAGIPAATYDTATEKLIPGTASCRAGSKNSAGEIVPSGTETVLVENQITSAVATSGKPMTIALNETSGNYEIIVEDCTGSSTGGGGDTLDPNQPDDVESFGFGMGIGV